MLRLGEDVGARAALDDLAALHDGDFAGDRLDHGEVVRDEDIGEVEPRLQVGEQRQDLRLDRDVERGYRLVEDDQLGPGGERAGDADALRLAAGEFVRIAVGELGRGA